MKTNAMEPSTKDQTNRKWFRSLLLAVNILAYVQIVMRGIARSDERLMPVGFGALFEDGHRVAMFLAGLAMLWVVVLAWRGFGGDRRIGLTVLGALGLWIAQALLDSVRLFSEQAWGDAVSLGLSLTIQGLLLVPLVWTFSVNAGRSLPGLAFRTTFARLSLITLAAVFLLLVSGGVVSATGASAACPSWPWCSEGILPTTVLGWIHMAHRLMVAGVGILAAVLTVQAWRTQRSQAAIITATTAGGTLFFAQALMGGYKVLNGFPLFMVSLHEATAAAVWAVMIVQAMTVGLAGRAAEEEQLDLQSIARRRGLAKDLLMLTKPVVVLLLLVTTFSGMVIGAKAWPTWELIFWTLLGGALAAGGSGAINQYIDRYDDTRMQRTEKRPIPAGRLTPGEGLAFGVALCLASFYLVTAFVNLLAALLTLAGIIYYVLIYSIFLKKTTVQNIVIGGGAGAIPPLVGWAAATGSLNIPSLFLFALVFLWTPPHFWALALVRRNDYARAGVPMLPVVRGEQETRWQIFLYTIELVALTLLLPLFGLGRGLYLISAGALGGWLLFSAWKVWRKGGNKTAWKMYRYSSMYLAFIFFALMVDRLVF